MTTWIGLDISKKTIDIGYSEGDKFKHFKIDNTETGFRELIKQTPENSQYVMEATGLYYYRCAKFLFDKNKYVSVVNPLKIKKAMSTNLLRVKSDKADSKFIAEWAELYKPKQWNIPKAAQLQCQSLQGLREDLVSSITRRKNKRESILQLGKDSGHLLKSVNRMIRSGETQIKLINAELKKLLDENFKEDLELLCSIPGVGPQTATAVVSKIGNGESFNSSGDLLSFLGLTPTMKQSGTSLNSRGRISRMGGVKIRAYLYMGALNAINWNPKVKVKYDRLISRGKHPKVALVAIMNTLVRQIFGILKSRKKFDPNFA